MQDLAIVEQTCERAVALLSAPGPVDQIVFRALSDAAIVRYARCFNSGQRYRLSPEMLSDLPGDPLGAHQFFYLMRDKHVGHSANAYEQLVMAVSVGEGAKGELTWGTAFTLHASHMAIDVDGFRMLRDLSRALQAKCQALRTTMGEAVRGELAKMTPTQMSGLKPYEFVAPGPDHVARRRRVKP